MKRFLRRLVMLAAVAGVILWVKDRVTQTGEHAAGGQSYTEPAGAKPADSSSTEHIRQDTSTTTTTNENDLTRVKGIGPVYRARLAEQGIASFRALAAADAANTAAAIDASVQQVEDWQEQASTLD